MKRKYRIRRMDEHNFVIERKAIKKKADSRESWDVLGYYPDIESLLIAGVSQLTWFKDTDGIRDALKTTENTLLRALYEAIDNGSLAYDREAASERGRKAAAAKKKKSHDEAIAVAKGVN